MEQVLAMKLYTLGSASGSVQASREGLAECA